MKYFVSFTYNGDFHDCTIQMANPVVDAEAVHLMRKLIATYFGETTDVLQTSPVIKEDSPVNIINFIKLGE